MTPQSLFIPATALAACGWLLLIFFPRRTTAVWTAGRGIPLVLCVLYAGALALSLPGRQGGFNSLSAVAVLFQNQWALLAGWVHYLAFDLVIGAWIVTDSAGRYHRVLSSIALIAAFFFGPIGFLIHMLLRGRQLAAASRPDVAAR